MRIFKRDLHLGNYRGKGRSGRSLNILSPYPTDPRHHHYVMRLKISRINIYLHIQRWGRGGRGGGEKDLTKAHEAILKGRRTLIYFLALPRCRAMEWNGIGNAQRRGFIAARRENADRESDTFVSFRPASRIRLSANLFCAPQRVATETLCSSFHPEAVWSVDKTT